MTTLIGTRMIKVQKKAHLPQRKTWILRKILQIWNGATGTGKKAILLYPKKPQILEEIYSITSIIQTGTLKAVITRHALGRIITSMKDSAAQAKAKWEN